MKLYKILHVLVKGDPSTHNFKVKTPYRFKCLCLTKYKTVQKLYVLGKGDPSTNNVEVNF